MSRRHEISSSPENMVWGYLDSTTPPVLEIASGDTVTLHSFPAGGKESLPEDKSIVPEDYLKALDTLVQGPGPHFITGPVYVKGAKPGDGGRLRGVGCIIADPRLKQIAQDVQGRGILCLDLQEFQELFDDRRLGCIDVQIRDEKRAHRGSGKLFKASERCCRSGCRRLGCRGARFSGSRPV